jgi:hypothetical protein
MFFSLMTPVFRDLTRKRNGVPETVPLAENIAYGAEQGTTKNKQQSSKERGTCNAAQDNPS